MKNILVAAVCCMAVFSQAQIEIITNGNVGVNEANPQRQLHVVDGNEIQLFIENKSSDGAGIRLENSNNYQWEIINESLNYWNHANALGFFNRSEGGYIPLILKPDNTVHIPHLLYIGGYSVFRMSQTGVAGQANGFDFNTSAVAGKADGTVDGLLIQQSRSESSGIYFDGDYCTIFSPGDQNRLLRVYDEDGMQERWYLDGSGVPFTNSDSTRKQQIENLELASNKLHQLKGKKYHFKSETLEATAPTNFTFANGMIGKDSVLVANGANNKDSKYDISTREYFGFLAQDVEKVFPNLVDTNEKGEKFVSYTEFIPLLVDGYNQQAIQLQTQQEEMEALLEKMRELEKLVEVLAKKVK